MLQTINQEILIGVLTKSFHYRTLRMPMIEYVRQFAYRQIMNDTRYPYLLQEKKFQLMSALLDSAVRNYEKGFINRTVVKCVIDTLVRGSFLPAEGALKARDAFKSKWGEYPPSFIVLSPTQVCNLRCIGCYAASSNKTFQTLDFATVEKISKECHDVMGHKFMTISGGEPFLYKSQGKTLFDIWEKYSDMFFLVYTNGTMMSKEIAARLSKLGNVTPAISVEGFREHTEKRRGAGVHRKILEAFRNLRQAGVPFGISVTATQNNFSALMGDEFYDYYLGEQGASYMWQFQMMPIGRARTGLDIIITPTQRVELYKKWKELLSVKHYMIADFWNSGVITNGCIAYGRDGGYLYIDWNGNILPCAFVPYYVDNIKELHTKGKGLSDAVFSDFFKNGRKWQRDYALKNPHEMQNLLMPCSIRDHYKNFKENILTKDAIPGDSFAESALISKRYYNYLSKYDERLESLTLGMWNDEYKAGESKE